MSCQALFQALIPCLGRSKSVNGEAQVKASITSTKPSNRSHGEIEQKGRIDSRSARGRRRIASFSSMHSKASGVTTTIVAELPAQPSPSMASRFRSLSVSTTASKASKKSGKRKGGTQALVISAPMDFRHVNGQNSSHATFTYPLSGRTRPLNLVPSHSHKTSAEVGKRPQTAPSSGAQKDKETIPQRSDSLPLRSRTYRLHALPPVPPLDIKGIREAHDVEGKEPMKRKPLPIRTRAISNPASPTYIPGTFAAEMLGSVPSPVELEASYSQPVKLDQDQNKMPKHKSIASLGSLPSPGIFSNRLSEGALKLLTSFPTTPRPLKINVGSTTEPTELRRQASKQEVQQEEIATKPQSAVTRASSSFSSDSPHTAHIGSPDLSVPPLNPRAYLQKSLPPTPKGDDFEKNDFVHIGSDIKFEDLPIPVLTPAGALGKKHWAESVSIGSDAESIHVFLANSTAGSPRW